MFTDKITLTNNKLNKVSVMLTRMKARKIADDEKATVKKLVKRVDLGKGTVEQVEDEVVSEKSICLYVDNKPFTTFTCSPTKTKELVIGNLLTQGIISRLEEIKHLQIQKGKVNVKLQRDIKTLPRILRKPEKKEASQDFILNPETILNAAKVLDVKAAIFRRTGGTHAAALLDVKGEVLVFSEDISRHNAVDKVIGEAALKRINLAKTLLASTGRVSSEIVTKAANANIPAIVSLASPTDKGIDAAERTGLTLIGFARDRRFNVYAHPERIRMNK